MSTRVKRARRTLRAAALASLILGIALPTAYSSSASASTGTTQNNGCLGVTGTFSQFAVPITGTASPNPATTADTITLSGVSVGISVDATLIGAGVTTGLVSAADSLADLGVTANDGTPNQSAGINAVTSAIGSVKLKIVGSNTSQATQMASNPALASVTFYVTADSA